MAELKDNGGPAFPDRARASGHCMETGLTKREWFAGMAMAGELASWRSSTDGHEFAIARRAFAMADAMLDASHNIDGGA